MDVTRATIYNWFTGKSYPRVHQQEKIRKALVRWQRRT
jgi:predicted DNA-binding transcriptional regulator AlpA